MIFYFIRHGHPEHSTDALGRPVVGGPAVHLSQPGIQRTCTIARVIQDRENRPFDRLITSPYNRARETAWVIAEVMQLNPARILVDTRLRDTDSTWPGEPLEIFLKVWEERKVFDDPHTLETLEHLRARMSLVVNDYVDSLSTGMIGFVGHGDPFRAWLFPANAPFCSYADLVKYTFESAEGIRALISGDGKIDANVIPDFTNM